MLNVSGKLKDKQYRGWRIQILEGWGKLIDKQYHGWYAKMLDIFSVN